MYLSVITDLIVNTFVRCELSMLRLLSVTYFICCVIVALHVILTRNHSSISLELDAIRRVKITSVTHFLALCGVITLFTNYIS